MPSTHEGAIYTYPFSLAFRLCWMTGVTVFGLFLGIVAAYRGEIRGGIVFSTLWCLFFLPISAIAILASSGVAVSKQSIACVIFGRRWRTIRWTDVKGIRIMGLPVFPSGRKMRWYYVDQADPPIWHFRKRGSIYFNESIMGIVEIRNALNVAIAQHNIPVKLIDKATTIVDCI